MPGQTQAGWNQVIKGVHNMKTCHAPRLLNKLEEMGKQEWAPCFSRVIEDLLKSGNKSGVVDRWNVTNLEGLPDPESEEIPL